MRMMYKWVDALNIDRPHTWRRITRPEERTTDIDREVEDVEIPFGRLESNEETFFERMNRINFFTFLYHYHMQNYYRHIWYIENKGIPPPPSYIPIIRTMPQPR